MNADALIVWWAASMFVSIVVVPFITSLELAWRARQPGRFARAEALVTHAFELESRVPDETSGYRAGAAVPPATPPDPEFAAIDIGDAVVDRTGANDYALRPHRGSHPRASSRALGALSIRARVEGPAVVLEARDIAPLGWGSVALWLLVLFDLAARFAVMSQGPVATDPCSCSCSSFASFFWMIYFVARMLPAPGNTTRRDELVQRAFAVIEERIRAAAKPVL